jgi:hypothetical protein
MKRLQTIADIEELKTRGNIATSFLNVIESEFMDWFEAEGTGESLTSFRLPNHSCMYLLEDDKDTNLIVEQIVNIEFIEKEVTNDCSYFRIGLMNDHQMNLIFFLEGTLDSKYEQWLQQ